MEPAVRLTAAPPPLPVARLQGDVLAEYLRFLELDEEAAPAPATRVPPVAWLQGEVRDEFLRFLEESAGGAAAVACPEEDEGVGFDGRGHGGAADDDDYESVVDDDDVCVMEYRSEDGGVVFTMDTEELDDDPVLELLRPHILHLPAFRARAAAAGMVRQQSPRAFPRQGGWMSSNDDEMTDDDGSFPRQEGRMRSELLRRRIQDLEARYRACAAEAEAVQRRRDD